MVNRNGKAYANNNGTICMAVKGEIDGFQVNGTLYVSGSKDLSDADRSKALSLLNGGAGNKGLSLAERLAQM